MDRRVALLDQYVSRKYDFDDVSDRLNLLAILYDEQGELERAIAVLMESKQYCASHNIPFDALDLLEELELDRASRAVPPTPRNGSGDKLDDAIRRAYATFGTAADEIVVENKLSRKFAQDVNRLLAGKMSASVQDVKRRLLALRRRGQAPRRAAATAALSSPVRFGSGTSRNGDEQVNELRPKRDW
jgi:hypothetical protein